jgi:hypothetical protein
MLWRSWRLWPQSTASQAARCGWPALRLAGAAAARRASRTAQPPLFSALVKEAFAQKLLLASNALTAGAQAAAWAEGRAMTLEQALAYAREDTGTS